MANNITTIIQLLIKLVMIAAFTAAKQHLSFSAAYDIVPFYK